MPLKIADWFQEQLRLFAEHLGIREFQKTIFLMMLLRARTDCATVHAATEFAFGIWSEWNEINAMVPINCLS